MSTLEMDRKDANLEKVAVKMATEAGKDNKKIMFPTDDWIETAKLSACLTHRCTNE